MIMIIVLECPLTIKKYIQFVAAYRQDVPCPCCGQNTRRHGKYERTVHTHRRSFQIPIMRRRCAGCRKTLSLIPCFLAPWARFINPIYECFGRALISGIPIFKLPERLTTEGVSVVSLRTLYRWKNRLRKWLSLWWINQRHIWAMENQEGDSLLSLYREGINSYEEIQGLLAFAFRGDIPRRGRLLSLLHLRRPIGPG
ncbi:DUF6431 domain-containing protein [Sporolactobacillus vineae]|uniref:DUF6431 domain-containing protein n=2 Tax=Sporolactobacillus vineae TaxID=444463 RepID=UPI0031F61A0E